MSKEQKTVLTLSINKEELKKFKHFCLDKDISVSEAVRRLMESARLKNEIEYHPDNENNYISDGVIKNGIDNIEGL